MVVNEMAAASKRLASVLKHKGLSDVEESELYRVLTREWWPYAQREAKCTDGTLDRLLGVAVQEWNRKGREKGRFLAFLTVRIRDFCTQFRPAGPRRAQYYVARELPLDWSQPFS